MVVEFGLVFSFCWRKCVNDHRSNGTRNLRILAAAVSMLLAFAACVRIVLTYRTFCQTNDEPAHIAAGMEWLSRGTYTFQVAHPPLARVAVAAGPFLFGLKMRTDEMWVGGNQILYDTGSYFRNLSLARLGVLPFFLLATWVVHSWARRLFGETAAVASVFVFTMLPPILGHAGVATTDLPVAATCAAALYTFTRWLSEPSYKSGTVLGVAVALAVLSKFTAILFLCASGIAVLGLWWWYEGDAWSEDPTRRRRRLASAELAALITCLVIWAGYRFSVGTLATTSPPLHFAKLDALVGSSGPLHNLSHWAIDRLPLPAPEFFRGLFDALQKDSVARTQYFLGKMHEGRYWYFFLVAVGFKSPIAFLILAGISALLLCKKIPSASTWQLIVPIVAAASILLVTMPLRVHAGIRHVLVLYPLLSIAAGFGAVALWNAPARQAQARVGVALLLAWLSISSIAAHPDYLPYFNELAGSHPERILVNSDLDWGQDLLRLGDALRIRKASSFALSYFGTADPTRHNLPPFTQLSPYTPTTGWVAISMLNLEMGKSDGQFAWLEAYAPVALVGRSIRLYYVPDQVLHDSFFLHDNDSTAQRYERGTFLLKAGLSGSQNPARGTSKSFPSRAILTPAALR
jgi:4-amino-4-deoxy-L-arabinose transferase-like glycosyltransferase